MSKRNKRITKKIEGIEDDFLIHITWWNDLRLYLMEALEDGSSLSVIRRQFKERYTNGKRRKSTRWFTATKMNCQFKEVMGSAWGREGLK